MPNDFVDILSIHRGLVTAPAGCGKTHLICDAVRRHNETKPILVLTHTNAGVAALRKRFNEASVPAKSYRLSTLDGFAMRLVGSFPTRSEFDLEVLKLENPKKDYPTIRKAACRLLVGGHLHDIIGANYARLIVDEYQDCCVEQHHLITHISTVLPTCILGDPLQAVFSWLGLPDWNEDVCTIFPVVAELVTPWRWINANAEGLGHWLLDVRRKLINNEPVDFDDSPKEVTCINLEVADSCYECQLSAANSRAPSAEGSILIIGNGMYPATQRRFASQIPGAVTIENVSLDDLIDFAKCFDCTSPDALSQLLVFSEKVMRNIGRQRFLQRIDSLENGRARNPASNAEKSAIIFKANPSPRTAVDLLVELNKDIGVSSHRPLVLKACLKALNACSCTEDGSFYETAICAREQNRLLGRSLPKRAVGSTLLLKGLESEVSVILNAADHDTNSLYVAMTRGSQRLVVCSYGSIWAQYK